jgi:hypothetical protein
MDANPLLTWLVPALFSLIGIAYLAGRMTMQNEKNRDAIIATHGRIDVMNRKFRGLLRAMVRSKLISAEDLVDPEDEKPELFSELT